VSLTAASLSKGLAWPLVIVSCALLGGLILAHVAGYQALTVVSGSMEPSIDVGDMVVNRSVSPLRARPGDVISFRDPTDLRRVITHRVRSVRVERLRAWFVTKGDANNATERWDIPIDGKIGQVELQIPKVGYALSVVRSPFGRIMFLALPALMLGASFLVAIWRPEEEPQAVY
jgi:signal peptidase